MRLAPSKIYQQLELHYIVKGQKVVYGGFLKKISMN